MCSVLLLKSINRVCKIHHGHMKMTTPYRHAQAVIFFKEHKINQYIQSGFSVHICTGRPMHNYVQLITNMNIHCVTNKIGSLTKYAQVYWHVTLQKNKKLHIVYTYIGLVDSFTFITGNNGNTDRKQTPHSYSRHSYSGNSDHNFHIQPNEPETQLCVGLLPIESGLLPFVTSA